MIKIIILIGIVILIVGISMTIIQTYEDNKTRQQFENSPPIDPDSQYMEFFYGGPRIGIGGILSIYGFIILVACLCVYLKKRAVVYLKKETLLFPKND
jgi:hypothetical protein